MSLTLNTTTHSGCSTQKYLPREKPQIYFLMYVLQLKKISLLSLFSHTKIPPCFSSHQDHIAIFRTIFSFLFTHDTFFCSLHNINTSFTNSPWFVHFTKIVIPKTQNLLSLSLWYLLSENILFHYYYFFKLVSRSFFDLFFLPIEKAFESKTFNLL